MLPALEKLLIVQDRDRHLAQMRRELARLPQERSNADAALARAQAELEAAKNSLKSEEIERKKLEVEAESKRASVNKWKTQLNSIKSNVEYQALLKEISTAEQEITALEDRELELMEREEEARRQIQRCDSEARAVAQRVAKQKTDTDAQEKTLRERMARLEEERAALAAEIDPDVFARYERILRSKQDVALAPIEHGNCGGCNLALPPEVIHTAKSGADLATCSNCGRIVYCSG